VLGIGLHGHTSPLRPGLVDFVRWARQNHALLLQRARQSLPPCGRLPAKGTAAANLLGCMRKKGSSDERRYYYMLRKGALCSEETLLLSRVWSSVSATLRTELEELGATLPATPAAGASVPGVGRELGAHAAVLRVAAPAECIPEHATPKKARAAVPGTGRREHTSSVGPGVVGFVQWAHRNHALLLRRAWQGPRRQSRLPAKGTAAANLLGCLREHHSTDERRYYHVLYRLIVGRYRAPCSEESLLLNRVWSSVSTTLRAGLEDADATPPVTPGAGAPVPGAGRELGAHAAALRATAPAACIAGRATPKRARASVLGTGLRGHMSRCGKKRRTTREP